MVQDHIWLAIYQDLRFLHQSCLAAFAEEYLAAPVEEYWARDWVARLQRSLAAAAASVYPHCLLGEQIVTASPVESCEYRPFVTVDHVIGLDGIWFLTESKHQHIFAQSLVMSVPVRM